MALTGLQIQKLLPKTNCKECGSNTCLAFAIRLAAKQADLSLCPYASEEAKQVLGAAAEPPVRRIGLGPDGGLELGEETVLYRHEKTFVHPTALAVNVNDSEARDSLEATLRSVRDYALERVGEILRVDMLALTQTGQDAKAFAELAAHAFETVERPLVLRSADPEALELAARAVAGSGSVLASATAESADRLRAAAAEHGHALAVTAPDLDALSTLVSELRDDGFNDLLLQFSTHGLAEQFQTNSIARRAALDAAYRPLGYPSLRFAESGDPAQDTIVAVSELLKYGGICVLPSFDAAQLAPLMTLRLNIYTDPQKPIQVEPGIYQVAEPGPESPVFLTTNFSLTYFLVSGEIENSGASAWLVVPECEGMSVLTAWAAGKLSGEGVAKFVKEAKLEDRVATRDIVIPGLVAQISGELEEALPGWKVLVGPQEAADIESFIRARLNPT